MKVLVSAASRHGATAEIAARVAQTLASHPDIDVTVLAPQDVDDISGFDAYVIGSAIYMGHWLEAARDLVHRHEGWREHPVWLFSSGPIGDPPKPDEQPVDVGAIVVAMLAREHRVFSGVLCRDRLGFAERAMVAALRAPYGDFRDWAAIEAWAHHIANTVSTATSPTSS